MTQEDYKRERRKKTREKADALLDDLSFFRALMQSGSVTAGDIRRMSAQLRRILVDEILEQVASCRIGKIKVMAPDITPLVQSNKKYPIPYLGVGGAAIFGVYVAMMMLDRGSKPRELSGFNVGNKVTLAPADFMKQGVMVLEGQWISRRQVIRYIANVADGVHGGEHKDELDWLIRRARHASTMSLRDGIPTFMANLEPFSLVELPALISRDKIDGVLLELWSAVSYLLESPDVQQLEAYIEQEPW